MSTPCVLLLDHSLLIEGIATYLAGMPGLRIVRHDPHAESLTEFAASLQPDFVIYEINTLRVEQLAALLAECPGLQLVGVHPEYNRLVVLRGRIHRFVAMQDLITLFENSKPAAQAPVELMSRDFLGKGAIVGAGDQEETERSQETMSASH
jgi:hypothetical protein